MKITAHAVKRCRQRGIPEYLLEIIQDYGSRKQRPYGAKLVSIGKKDLDKIIHELKTIIQQVDKLKKKKVSIIMAEDKKTIITTYRQR
jgi:hypothetical protein